MPKRVLVVGDIMLDHYVYVNSERYAAEASIPVWEPAGQHEWRLGGAANVAYNLKSLGKNDVDVAIAGICSNAELEFNLLNKAGLQLQFITGGRTMVKRRYVHGKQIIFRFDETRKFSEHDVSTNETSFTDLFHTFMKMYPFDMIVISDYDKGTITQSIINAITDYGGIPKLVDSKRLDLEMFRGFDICKLNSYEHSAQLRRPMFDKKIEELFRYMVVTRGPHGADLISTEGIKNFPAVLVDSVVDVTGCGDTHLAGMAFSLLFDKKMDKAVEFANTVASRVVQKFGTSIA